MPPMMGKGMKVPEKSKRGIKGVIREIITYSDRFKIPGIIALVLAALGAVLTIIGPNQISRITDLISGSLFGEIDLAGIASVATTLLIIYALSSLFMFMQHYIMATITLDLSRKMRSDLSAKINKVPMSFYNTASHGDILSRVSNDVSTLQQTLANSLPSMASAVAQFAGCLLMMFISEWHLAAAAVLVTLLGFLLMSVIMKHSQKYFISRQKSLGDLNGFIEETYTNHDAVRISRAEEKTEASFKSLNQAVYDANWKSQFLSGMMQPLMNVIGNLGYVTVCILGAVMAINGQITIGTIVAFIMYVRLFTSPLSTIAQGMTNMQSAAAAGDRVFDFLQEKEMPDESSKSAAVKPFKGDVVFDHVRFCYPDSPDKIIIKDFSAHVTPGEKVAIVGPTGAGKTTMVNLLMKFFDIQSGQIRIDGVPISDMKRESVHDLFSMVLQDTWMFDGTVRENLVYNRTGITDEMLEEACRACGIYHFIETLPDGFDTVLGENITVSAGQKQLLTIARAMIQNNPMLILDEATSSVDTRTELITQKAMDQLMAHRTSFVIAHRLSTIRNADLILVMNDGNIIEQGTHEQLLKQGGFYAELYNSQFDQSVS
jgi:ATP-binding cassette subfamily B multidrug efflux pump